MLPQTYIMATGPPDLLPNKKTYTTKYRHNTPSRWLVHTMLLQKSGCRAGIYNCNTFEPVSQTLLPVQPQAPLVVPLAYLHVCVVNMLGLMQALHCMDDH
jgi:hypothetical protein